MRSRKLLKQEVREPALYNAIITAIATGASRMSEISGKVGESTNICSAYVKNLISLGIIEKETPYGGKGVPESDLLDCGQYVPLLVSLCAGKQFDHRPWRCDLAYKRIEPYLSDYMGKVFEEICKQYLWKQLLSGECRWSFPLSAAGGATILRKSVRLKSIFLPNRIKHRSFRRV